MAMDAETLLKLLYPPGVEPRTPEENETYRRRLLVSFIMLLVMSGLIVGLRMYAKLKIVRNLGIDDMATLAAFVRLVPLLNTALLIDVLQLCAIAMTACFCHGITVI